MTALFYVVPTVSRIVNPSWVTQLTIVSAYSGKMVSQRHYQRLQNLLKETNGEIVIGGKTKDEGNYIEPTVVVNVKMDDALLRDELFGPILPIVEVKDINEAIKIVRADEKPLASYCFGEYSNI